MVAPVALSVYTLGQEHISFLDSVTAGFGWFLAEHFEPEKAALFWVAIASLAASIYYGYGARAATAPSCLLSLCSAEAQGLSGERRTKTVSRTVYSHSHNAYAAASYCRAPHACCCCCW